jgi:hypothetical protein
MRPAPDMGKDEAKFKRYLVREFFWELAQHEPVPTAFAGLSQEAVEVMVFEGYDDMRVRVADRLYDVHLSWRKNVAPGIQEAH